MSYFQQIINSLSTGSLYALLALGYTLVFGVLRFINFSHGEIMMVGAYIGFVLTSLNQNIWVSILLSGVFCGFLGYILEKLLYKPLRNTNSLNVLVCALGASILMQYIIMLIFGSEPKGYPPSYSSKAIEFKNIDVVIDSQKLIVFILSVIICITLTLFFKKTRIGLAIRGYSSERTAALICGINPDRMVSLSFIIGCVLAGFTGVLYGSIFLLSPFMGIEPGLKAFTAAVLGGIGSIPGAFLGGITLGFAETFACAFISSSFKNLISFVILIITLLFFPSGILKKGASGVAGEELRN